MLYVLYDMIPKVRCNLTSLQYLLTNIYVELLSQIANFLLLLY